MDPAPKTPCVYLVGAGPGDPGLLTLRAVECLAQADFVLHDYLTSPRVLDYVPAAAELLCVDRLPGEHPQRWPHIHQKLIDEARKGKVVVHLKGGDPLIFGRGGEEAEGLRAAGIPYEIVPGVTAAFAAGAYAEIPLTHREHASAIAIVTGHEHPGKAPSRLDWAALAQFPGTLAVYMAVARLGVIAAELVARGKPADTPAALVHKASTGEQQTIVGTLTTIEDRVRLAGVTSPALVLIGPVAGLKPAASWFEARPLVGLRVLVTRPRHQALPFMRQLELLGAVPFLLSAIEFQPPTDGDPADAAIRRLREGDHDWVVFTSANGVTAFLQRLTALDFDARAFGRAKIAAIGPATAAALAEYHLVADLTPAADLSSEHLAARLVEPCRGKRVLIAQAEEGRVFLRDRLREVATVDTVAVYRQVESVDAKSDVFDRLRRGEIHAVTLTSPNIAKAFLAACDETVRNRFRDGHTSLVANSTRLKGQLMDMGFPAVAAPNPTAEGLIAALKELKRKGDRSSSAP